MSNITKCRPWRPIDRNATCIHTVNGPHFINHFALAIEFGLSCKQEGILLLHTNTCATYTVLQLSLQFHPRCHSHYVFRVSYACLYEWMNECFTWHFMRTRCACQPTCLCDLSTLVDFYTSPTSWSDKTLFLRRHINVLLDWSFKMIVVSHMNLLSTCHPFCRVSH